MFVGMTKDVEKSCQVPGCVRPLPKSIAYYARYRICPYHASLPNIIIDGIHQKWCQQCGRFHDMSSFEDNRKTCKKKLEMHNAQRRRARERKAIGSPTARGNNGKTKDTSCVTMQQTTPSSSQYPCPLTTTGLMSPNHSSFFHLSPDLISAFPILIHSENTPTATTASATMNNTMGVDEFTDEEGLPMLSNDELNELMKDFESGADDTSIDIDIHASMKKTPPSVPGASGWTRTCHCAPMSVSPAPLIPLNENPIPTIASPLIIAYPPAQSSIRSAVTPENDPSTPLVTASFSLFNMPPHYLPPGVLNALKMAINHSIL